MAERDSKQALGLGSSGSTTASFIVDITGSITDMRQSLNLAVQEVRNLNQALTITKSLTASLNLSGLGMGGSPVSGDYSPGTTLVAASPKFTPPANAPLALNAPNYEERRAIGGGNGSYQDSYGYINTNSVAATPRDPFAGRDNIFTGNTNLTDFVKENPASAALYASSVVSGMLKSPADMVEAQLLLQRAATFSGGEKEYVGGSILGRPGYKTMSGSIGKVVQDMVKQGMANNDMDAIRALAAAQSIGITGPNVTQAAGGYGAVTQGVAAVSNLMPGLGMEGGMRAFASMQQGRNVNRLRGLGIRLRDEEGNLKPPSQIIEDIWAKICRDYAQAYGEGRKPSERELLIGLQPGNSMDSFLDQYFGNDPMAKQMIANGLLFKAKTTAKGQDVNLNTLTREEAAQAGFSTTATNAYFRKEQVSTEGTLMYNSAGAAGYDKAATLLTGISAGLNKLMPNLIAQLTAVNGFVLTLLGAGDNAIGKLLAGIIAWKSRGKADGGNVQNQVPYVVGEEGPELFVPETNGNIIPNHQLDNYGARNNINIKDIFRHHGGSVKDTGPDMTQDEWANAFITKLGATPNAVNIAAVKTWMAQENGHWGNTAGYNPLNTTYLMEGSVKYGGKGGGKQGVQHYVSWQQGLDASVNTLLGKDHAARGYDDIVAAIKEGKDQTTILRAISHSKWGTHFPKYAFDKAKSGTTESSTNSSYNEFTDFLNSMYGEDLASQFGNLPALFKQLNSIAGTNFEDPTSSLQSLVGSGFGGAGGSSITAGQGSKTVVINISGATEASKIVEQVKAELKKEGFLVKTGGK